MIILAAGALFCAGCLRSCAPRGGAPAGHTDAEERPAAPADSEEAREAAAAARMRQQAFDSLATYRAPSCAAAIAKLEQLLRRGQGRWLDRTAGGALPDDLLAILSEAALRQDQAAPLCVDDSQHARFEQLRLLIDAIWRYPVTMSKAELERRLQTLGDQDAGEHR